MIAHLHRLTNTEKEKYSSQLFFSTQIHLSVADLHLFVETLRTGQEGRSEQRVHYEQRKMSAFKP